jgi:hypothetical protein
VIAASAGAASLRIVGIGRSRCPTIAGVTGPVPPINVRRESSASLSTLAGCVGHRAGQGAPPGMQNRSYEDGFAVMASDRGSLSGLACCSSQDWRPTPAAGRRTPYSLPRIGAFQKRPDILQDLLPNSSQAFPGTSDLIPLIRAHVVYGLHPFEEIKSKKLTIQSAVGTPIEVDGTNPQAITVTWQSVQGQNAQARYKVSQFSPTMRTSIRPTRSCSGTAEGRR